MKKILLVLIAATLLTSVYAQDLLVIEGNSINCRINREYKNYVSYTYREGKDIREGLVERSKITAMVKDFYAESDISKEAINALSDAKGVPWLIGISFGGGYRIARTASGADADSVNSTRLGYVIEGNANYYFNDY
ncbi:MAG: hypothetical protein FWH39_04010, partial [Bacteroidales bacterium]|nr:hypothetical protein [Bacteroidales bacterium]